ncbi:MAG: NAD(P)H-dependent glycerol-3-phosphate dehydrogenase [Paracoccaceae bacterium]
MIGVIGAGAFGSALAVAFARGGLEVQLWARDAGGVRHDHFPDTVIITTEMASLRRADAVLICIPMQQMRGFLQANSAVLNGLPLIACCKGLDLTTLEGPTAQIAAFCPDSTPAILTGPSFAADIIKGLPTALTLACASDAVGETLQQTLISPNLRLYRNTDVTGAELGGAIKNVIAIACGAAIGQGLGESARAALMTRGFAEMHRLAVTVGARPDTLMGLSGFGDMVLTCTSEQSRNFRYGLALGREQTFDASITVEGVATAQAAAALATKLGVDMPITTLLAAITKGQMPVTAALDQLFARPLKPE